MQNAAMADQFRRGVAKTNLGATQVCSAELCQNIHKQWRMRATRRPADLAELVSTVQINEDLCMCHENNNCIWYVDSPVLPRLVITRRKNNMLKFYFQVVLGCPSAFSGVESYRLSPLEDIERNTRFD